MRKLVGAVVLSTAMAFSTVVFAPSAFAAGWSCRSLPDYTAATNPALAVDANAAKAAVTVGGVPHVFFQELGSWDLKHSWKDATHGWWFETVDGNSTVGGRTTHAVGDGVSARVDGAKIIVTYVDGTNGDVRQAVLENGAWRYEVAYNATTTRAATGWTADAATTAAVNLGVFHTRGTYGEYYALVFRERTGSSWREHLIDTNLREWSSVTAAYVGYTLHVWYGKSDGRDGTVLAHAWAQYESPDHWGFDTAVPEIVGWRTEVLDGGGGTRGRTDTDVGTGLSVATVGQNGAYPHVFYSDDTRKELRHAWWNGATWTFETLDGDRTLANGRTDGETGFAPSVVNLNGVLHVFYSDWNTGLRHAWFANQWGYEQLDGSAAAAGHCSGYTRDKVFGPTATTLVGSQIYSFSSTMSATNYHAVLRLASYG
jgi:hypothetical protein